VRGMSRATSGFGDASVLYNHNIVIIGLLKSKKKNLSVLLLVDSVTLLCVTSSPSRKFQMITWLAILLREQRTNGRKNLQRYVQYAKVHF
jgi:hypothetical protein